MDHELTLDELKAMERRTIFARGSYTRIGNVAPSRSSAHWVAVRGEIWDWAVYQIFDAGDYCVDWEQVSAFGDKIHNMDIVKRLVPATKQALEWYRH